MVRYRILLLACVAGLAAWGCSDPETDASPMLANPETEVLQAGSGPANVLPLQPLRNGMRAGPSSRPDLITGPHLVQGRTLWRREYAEGDASWLEPRSDGVYLHGSRVQGLYRKPVLWIPQPARAGLQWRGHFDDGSWLTFTVQAPQTVATELGMQTVWTVQAVASNGAAATPRSYVEGAGSKFDGLYVVPQNDVKAAPSVTRTPLSPLGNGKPVVAQFRGGRVSLYRNPKNTSDMPYTIRVGGAQAWYQNTGMTSGFLLSDAVACLRTDGQHVALDKVVSGQTDAIYINPPYWSPDNCQDAGAIAYAPDGKVQTVSLMADGSGIAMKRVGGVGGASHDESTRPLLALFQRHDGKAGLVASGPAVGGLILQNLGPGQQNWWTNDIPTAQAPALVASLKRGVVTNQLPGTTEVSGLFSDSAQLVQARLEVDGASVSDVATLGWSHALWSTTVLDAAHRTHLLTDREGAIWRLDLDGTGAHFSLLAHADLPAGHELAGALSVTAGELLVLTTGGFHGLKSDLHAAPDAFGLYAFRLKLPGAIAVPPELATPVPPAQGIQAVASGLDVVVCAQVTSGKAADWSLQGWTLAGQPAQAIHAGDRCVVVLRPDAAKPSTAMLAMQTGQFAVTGTIPGVGPVALGITLHDGTPGSQNVLDGGWLPKETLAPLADGGMVSRWTRFAPGGVPLHACPMTGVDSHPNVGDRVVPDAAGHGLWAVPAKGATFPPPEVDTCTANKPCAELLRVDGTVHYLRVAVPPQAKGGGPEIVAPAQGGGLVMEVSISDGSNITSYFHVAPDGATKMLPSPTNLQLKEKYRVAGLLADGTVCGLKQEVIKGQDHLVAFCIDPAGKQTEGPPYTSNGGPYSSLLPTQDGRFVPVAHPFGFSCTQAQTLDPKTMKVQSFGPDNLGTWYAFDAQGGLWGRQGLLLGPIDGNGFAPSVPLPPLDPSGQHKPGFAVDVGVFLVGGSAVPVRLAR